MKRLFACALMTAAISAVCFGLQLPVPPTLVKSFSPSKIAPGGTTTLTFTITNPNAATILTGISFTDTFPSVLTVTLTNPNTTTTLTGLAFTDTLPAGLVVPISTVVANTCGGTVTTTPNSISLSGGALAPGASCTITATVAATGAAIGLLTNTT